MGLSIAGRVAVITGASRGIGAAMAKVFSERGLKLGLCARGAPALAGSPTVLRHRLDVSDAAAVDAFGDAVCGELGPIDLWINNAGVLEPMAPARDIDSADYERLLRINVLGVFNGSRAFARQARKAAHPGVLINISSGAATRPLAGWSAYCASKAAVNQMTECIALEEPGLRVHAVAPGVIDTTMQQQIRGASEDQFPARQRFVQMKQDDVFSSPRFVAERLLDLAFDPAHRVEPVVTRLPDEKPRTH